jgi:carbamoyltransferase
MSTILGLNAYRANSAACLFVDGKLVAAAEEERFRRVKHWAGLPTEAIDYCFREAHLAWRDIEHIAVNRKPDVKNWRDLLSLLRDERHPKLIWQKFKKFRNTDSFKEKLEQKYNLPIKAQVHYVEHHLAHLASAFLVSGFKEAACLSIDGFGEVASTAFGFGSGNAIKIDQQIYLPHSLGIFYSALTQFIGFPHYGDECKLMELAPFGEPAFLDQMREIIRSQPDGTFQLNLKYFRHHTADIPRTWHDCMPQLGPLYGEQLTNLLGPARKPDEPLEKKHMNIACSVQAAYEKAFFELLQSLHRQHPFDNLALAGGCVMNSVANGKVYRRTLFKRMYLPAAAGNAGGAIGAAAVVQAQLAEVRHQQSEVSAQAESQPPAIGLRSPMSDVGPLTSNLRPLISAYLGPDASEEEIHALLDWKRKEIVKAGCTISYLGDEAELVRRAAQAIADGKLVGWFQGRMEWGPRALGNRSILADPRRTNMKDLFAKMNRLESFRPFAASILREAVGEWYEQEDDVPFMMEVFQMRPENRDQVPAVRHVDGSGYLQTVHKETNPRYHALISEFHRLTSVPMVLNTSFNENEPVVCYPEEALECFLRTNMDILVLENFFLERKTS